MIVVVKTALTLPDESSEMPPYGQPRPTLLVLRYPTHTHWTTKMLLWDYAVWPREHLHHLTKRVVQVCISLVS